MVFSMYRPWVIQGWPVDNLWIAHVALWIPINHPRTLWKLYTVEPMVSNVRPRPIGNGKAPCARQRLQIQRTGCMYAIQRNHLNELTVLGLTEGFLTNCASTLPVFQNKFAILRAFRDDTLATFANPANLATLAATRPPNPTYPGARKYSLFVSRRISLVEYSSIIIDQ